MTPSHIAATLVLVTAAASMSHAAEVDDTLVLVSFFWPDECCGDEALMKNDRCLLWQGYCTTDACGTCDTALFPLARPFQLGSRIRGARQCGGACSCGQHDGWLPSPQSPELLAPPPVDIETDHSLPPHQTPAPTGPPETAAPINVIPTARRGRRPKAYQPRIAGRFSPATPQAQSWRPRPSNEPTNPTRLVEPSLPRQRDRVNHVPLSSQTIRMAQRSRRSHVVPASPTGVVAASPGRATEREIVAPSIQPADLTVEENPTTRLVEISPLPPDPSIFDYHYPSGVRTALDRPADTKLLQQLRDLADRN